MILLTYNLHLSHIRMFWNTQILTIIVSRRKKSVCMLDVIQYKNDSVKVIMPSNWN